MSISLKIARRYLFSKKSNNVINLITYISISGIAIGTMALILVMSVFNGFEDLIVGMFNSFNPDLKVTPIEGKVFVPDSVKTARLQRLKGVLTVCKSVEEIAFFEYDGNQDFGVLKGVDTAFSKVSNVDSNMVRGGFLLEDGGFQYALLGVGMEYKLQVNVLDPFHALNVYMPKRKRAVTLQQAFQQQPIQPVGTFSVQHDFDDQYVLTPLRFAQSLMGYTKGEVSALEIALQPTADHRLLRREVAAIMGEDFVVKDRYMQDEAFFKLMNMEKWIGYAVVSLTLLLISFNTVGVLWMVVLDKRNDIAILKSMGATDGIVQQIFLAQGVFISIFGAAIGFGVALLIYILQKTIGLVRLSGGANLVVEAYPISLRLADFGIVLLTVIAIGLLAAYLPSSKARLISPLARTGL